MRRNQRYDEDGSRLVVGTVPIQVSEQLNFQNPKTGYDDRIRVLLVSSRKKPGDWVLPKGGWELNEEAFEGAERETWEEAGVRGKAEKDVVARGKVVSKHGKPTTFLFFPMRIETIENTWPEQHERERRWVSHYCSDIQLLMLIRFRLMKQWECVKDQ